MRRTLAAGALVVGTCLALTIPATARATTAPPPPKVLHVGEAASQNVEPQPGSEPDTLVEPDIAVSPFNPDIAVAAAHNGRFPDGGAVAILYAWTRDGGEHWMHGALPGLTKATGGVWDRASDPVVAFGPDGSVYISTLPFSTECPSGIAVSRSTDGGRTFGKPVLVHKSRSCDYSDDKNWLTVDTSPRSPHFGRLYQFWTPFIHDPQTDSDYSLQVVRWSDDKGKTWSKTVNITEPNTWSQNSQPMIQPDGTIIDTYLDYGPAGIDERAMPESTRAPQPKLRTAPRAQQAGTTIAARISRDGGASWSEPFTVTEDSGEGPTGIRCCLPSATGDPLTGRLYTAWVSLDSSAVMVSQSSDGKRWSTPTPATPPRKNFDYINVDLAAAAGYLYVSSSTRDLTREEGRYAQQQVSVSRDGTHFSAPTTLGPPSDLNYAAYAGGIFPGDYMGSAVGLGKYYSAWCWSSEPAHPNAQYHQTLWTATTTAFGFPQPPDTSGR